MLWPILFSYWAMDMRNPYGPAPHFRQQGFWYTFDTQNPVADFLYHGLSVIELPALLALADVLILGTLICIPIYLVTLIRRWWVK